MSLFKMAHNSEIYAIQKIEPMENLKDKLLLNIYKGMENKLLSNNDLVQIIESAGSYLNLMTIADYAKTNNISYNGAKKHRHVQQMFKVKFIIDNQ